MTLRIFLGGLGGTVTLVALGSALSGLVDLGSVGARVAHASGLACHVPGVALLDAADLRGEGGRGGRGGSAGDGGRLLGQGEDAGGESENGNGVLHFDF